MKLGLTLLILGILGIIGNIGALLTSVTNLSYAIGFISAPLIVTLIGLLLIYKAKHREKVEHTS